MPRRSAKNIFWDGAYYSSSDLLDQELKQCSECKEVKSLVSFYRRGTRGGGLERYYMSMCKACHGIKYQENTEVIREKRREQRTGAPPGTYDLLVKRHGALCAICGTYEPEGTGRENRQFSIDHDHETNIIRGLLCTQCNVGIGMFKHDPRTLMSAIHYLNQRGYTLEELKDLLRDELASW